MGQDKVIGLSLPKIELESSEGHSVKLPGDWKGKWTLLYFYPRDNTPGCTTQACSYRDDFGRFQKLGVQVYGVSRDSLKSHNGFINKFSLNFPLLSDKDRALGGPLGVYEDRGLVGKLLDSPSRDTFLIDPSGVIRWVSRKVSPKTTVEETFNAAQEIIKS